MLKIGSIISNRVILAMTHKFVLAQCVEESPEPFTVWRLYDDMSGVHSGSYFKNKMDAEWEFCSLAFPWFQDNVNIQDPDEETASEGQAQGQADRIDVFNCTIQKAKNLNIDISRMSENALTKKQSKERECLITSDMIHDMSKQFQSSFGSSNSPMSMPCCNNSSRKS